VQLSWDILAVNLLEVRFIIICCCWDRHIGGIIVLHYDIMNSFELLFIIKLYLWYYFWNDYVLGMPNG